MTVVVEKWTERGDGLLSIEAAIWVERESQKGIVIGAGGRLLKQVGTEARRQLESFFNTKVMLRLWVGVRPGWRDDARAVAEVDPS